MVKTMKRKSMVMLTLLALLVGNAAAVEFETVFDVGSGRVDVDVTNTEADVQFTGIGSFGGRMASQDTGNYLDTDVEVDSVAGATFEFAGRQELAGYTNNEAYTYARTVGTEEAGMNLRYDNSMYVVQTERVNTGKDFLRATGSFDHILEVGVRDKDTQDVSAYSRIDFYGDGTSRIDTNQWHATATVSYGWGNPDRLVAPNLPGYYTPTNEVEATGSGNYEQRTYGQNRIVHNGFESTNGGLATTTVSFSGVFTGNPTAEAS